MPFSQFQLTDSEREHLSFGNSNFCPFGNITYYIESREHLVRNLSAKLVFTNWRLASALHLKRIQTIYNWTSAIQILQNKKTSGNVVKKCRAYLSFRDLGYNLIPTVKYSYSLPPGTLIYRTLRTFIKHLRQLL